MLSSTPRLSEFAKSFVFPVTIRKTVWPRVEAKGRELGLRFDWWQSQLGTVCLGYDEAGLYAATVGGIGLSIPRQVGKTYFVLALLFILCILFPGFQVVWTSHHLRTTSKTMTAARGMARRKKIAPHIKAVRTSHGEGQIEFVNGSMIMFGARSQGFGRGFDEIDAEVFDEAQILDTKALEDMIAATNQARHEHGALLFFMGTPPRPTDPSEAFTSRRTKARTGKAPNAVWLEIGADPESEPDDKTQWPKMNPSFPARTPPESMERLRENLDDDDSWNREGRGIWDDPASAGRPISAKVWAAAKSLVDSEVSSPVISVDMRTGAKQSLAIGVASIRADGFDDIDIARYELGSDEQWARDYAVAEAKTILIRFGLDSVAIDQYGEGNGLLIPMFEEAGVTVVKLNSTDMRNGAVGLVDAVVNKRVLHHNDQYLNAAVAGAVKRKSGEGFLWDQTKATVDLTPLRAVTAAWWVLQLNRSANYDVSQSFY